MKNPKTLVILKPQCGKFRKTLLITSFFVLVFCGACQKTEYFPGLSKQEKEDLHYFLRQIMDHESGAYVLFGSKPLCTGFLKANPKQVLNDETSWHSPENGWEVWQKIKNSIPEKRYILIAKPLTIHIPQTEENFELFFVVFANVQRTASVLSENYGFFKEFIGEDFTPLQLAEELEDPDSVFWNWIFGFDHSKPGTYLQSRTVYFRNRACGLLFGFGELNSTQFAYEAEIGENPNTSPRKGSLDDFGENNILWADFLYEHGVDKFLVPGFTVFEGDRMVERYKQERKKIRSLYKGHNFLEVTLRKLFEQKDLGTV